MGHVIPWAGHVHPCKAQNGKLTRSTKEGRQQKLQIIDVQNTKQACRSSILVLLPRVRSLVPRFPTFSVFSNLLVCSPYHGSLACYLSPKSHLNCIKLLVLVNEEVIHLRRYRKLYENSSSTEPPNKQLRKTTLIICFLIGINDKWQFLGRKTVLCNSAFLSLFAYSFLFSSSLHVASRGLRSVIVLLLF
jgi:hypothetical protein